MEQVASEETRVCPVCAYVAATAAEEIAHMTTAHPEVIAKRLREAGIEIHDYRSGPDLPSIMSLFEFRQVVTFIEYYAAMFPGNGLEVSVLVRDRGEVEPGETGIMASWIEFSVGKRQFAMWRATGDLYEVGPDGAVGEEPLHRND